MNDFIFITDLHLQTSSNVRTGDYLDDVSLKLRWAIDYANMNDAQILIGGDLFNKPSVPDVVKTKIIPILRSAIYTPISIQGNHDILYNSEDYNEKTSYTLLQSAGIITDITGSFIDTPSLRITNVIPVEQCNKPQIVLYHGFLNKEDGRWTFRFDDIAQDVTDPVYVCLGHDHVVYEPLKFKDNIKIFRPGSFSRVTREEASNRIPTLLHIKLKDGKLLSKTVPIADARPPEELFSSKLTTVSKASQQDTYDSIISQLKNANSKNMNFSEALQFVTTEDVSSFILKTLNNSRIENQHKNKNL